MRFFPLATGARAADPVHPFGFRPPLLLALVVALAGCGDDGSTGPATVATVTVSPGESTVEIEGSTAFTAEALDAGGDPVRGVFVAWSTGNDAIATISSSGEAYGRGGGETTVTATVDGVRGQATLMVVAPVPTAPSNLSAALLETGGIQLTWRDNSRYETGFEVQRLDPSTSSFETLATPGADAEEYTDAAVAPDGEYTYRVVACNASGCSAATAEVSAGTPPSAPTELRVVSSAAESVQLSWSDNSGTETAFAVERREGSGSWSEVARVGADATGYTDEGLTPDTDYGYRVRACSAAGCSAYSPEVSPRTSSLAAPGAPSDIASWLLDPTRVVVTWSDNSATETAFEVQRATGSGTFSLLATTDDNVSAYSDQPVAPDTRYRYRVRACNGGGCSAYSGESVVATLPVPPTDLAVSAVDDSTATLTWTDASQTETQIRVERRRESEAYVLVALLDADVTTYTDANLARNTEYTYRIRGCNDSGCSAYSAAVSVVTPVTAPPAAPSGLSAVVEFAPRIVLLWDDNSEVETGFEIERKVDGGSYTLLTTVAADVETYTDTDVVNETVYGYRIRACGAAGCSSYSNEVLPETPLTPPSGLAATAISPSSVSITWSDNSDGETEYRLERAEGPDTFVTTAIFILPAGTESFVDTGLQASTEYRYRVRACNDVGCSSLSPEAGATTPSS